VEADVRRPLDTEGVLELTLSTHTPEFDTYLIRFDSGDWVNSGERVLWALREGRNLLEIKTRNKWGRFGPESVFELEYRPSELRAETVDQLEIPNAGFEEVSENQKQNLHLQAHGWRMIYRDDFQRPEFYGTVTDQAHTGLRCFKIRIKQQGQWGKLFSSRFRVNQASDVSLKVWLRTSGPETPVKVFLEDASPDGPGREGFLVNDYSVGTEWTECVLKARLSARTTDLMVGLMVLEGTVWVDDFSIREDARAELPW
jgi:hypothetical protein